MIRIARSWLRFSTLNQGEMAQFDKISNWWEPSGPMQMLYHYNYHRVRFLVEHLGSESQPQHPLEGLSILDVGCGAGFLTKSLTRLGATVVGLDPNTTSFNEAKKHQQLYAQELKGLTYKNTTIEEYLEQESKVGNFDIVTSMDVIEHVDRPTEFLKSIARAAKDGGSVMVSTIARRPQTWLTHIALAEYVTRLVPRNTHHYDKFINPEELQGMMSAVGIERKARLELGIDWRGELIERVGGGNYICLGRKKESEPAKR